MNRKRSFAPISLEMSPERSIEIQECLGSDIAMVLDHVIGLPAARSDVKEASDRSIRWAERCLKAATRADQAQFAIVQGGLDEGLRQECARALCSMDFPGYAIGGLSVGEEPSDCLLYTSPSPRDIMRSRMPSSA